MNQIWLARRWRPQQLLETLREQCESAGLRKRSCTLQNAVACQVGRWVSYEFPIFYFLPIPGRWLPLPAQAQVPNFGSGLPSLWWGVPTCKAGPIPPGWLRAPVRHWKLATSGHVNQQEGIYPAEMSSLADSSVYMLSWKVLLLLLSSPAQRCTNGGPSLKTIGQTQNPQKHFCCCRHHDHMTIVIVITCNYN